VIVLTLAEIAAAVGAGPVAAAQVQVTGAVQVDSRRVGPGDLFVALPGDRVDGHGFVATALAAGAAGAIVTRVPDHADPRRLVQVEDSQVALGRLAAAVVGRLGQLQVIGITGSAGKTSTKDMLAQVLAAVAPTVAPTGNQNNEIGVPLTALGVAADTRYLVSEMGARGIGHIRYLTGLVHPRVGVVLNVGTAHLGEFGSREAIAEAKGELVAALPADGTAVLFADDPLVAGMADRTRARVLWFGRDRPADVAAEQVELDPHGRASFRLRLPGQQPVAVRLGFVGAHHVANALAAAAAAHTVGLSADAIAAGLTAARPVARWRMQVTERPDGITVINDAYNASPDSMAAALRTLATVSAGNGTGPARRSVAVLGEMLELGPDGPAEHRRIGALVAELGIDRLLAVGEGARPIYLGARDAHGRGRATIVADRTEALRVLTAELTSASDGEPGEPGWVVLVKSSRDAGLRWLGDELAGLPPDPGPDA
jgi:UDP-N-acetylmuramoyl-tripeptide--D-alanyl-D-alanine ligase